MKKIIAMLAVLLVLTGCGSANTNNPDNGSNDTALVVLKAGAGSYTAVSSKDVTDGAGSAEVITTYAAVVVDAEGIIKYVHFDTAQNKASIDAEGKVSIEAALTKRELGENYGMSKYANTNEWDKQIAHLESQLIGMNIADAVTMELDEKNKSLNEDVLSGCTIGLNEFILALDAANRNLSDVTGAVKAYAGSYTTVSAKDVTDGKGSAEVNTTFGLALTDAEDKIVYSRLDNLSKSYQDFINTYCGGDKKVVLDSMAEYAKCFAENFKPEYCNMSIPAAAGIERINIVMFGLKTTTLIPYVLYVAKNVADKVELNKIYSILESYIMRRLIVHATTKNYNNLFTSLILNNVLDAESLKERLFKGGDASTYIPTDEDLFGGFINSKLINLQTKGILYLMEAGIRPARSSTALLGFNSYSLEHLLPKKWRNNWPPCDSDEKSRQRDSVLLTLGNLAIIPQSLNASIRDGAWNVKKVGKGNDNPGLTLCAAGLTTIHDALQKDEWNEKEISLRAQWLFEQATKLWAI